MIVSKLRARSADAGGEKATPPCVAVDAAAQSRRQRSEGVFHPLGAARGLRLLGRPAAQLRPGADQALALFAQR